MYKKFLWVNNITCISPRGGDYPLLLAKEHYMWEFLIQPWQCVIKIHFENRASLVVPTCFWLCSFLQTPLVMLNTHSLGLFVPGKQRANSPGYSNPFLTLCNYLEKCFDRSNEKLGHFRCPWESSQCMMWNGDIKTLYLWQYQKKKKKKRANLFSCGIWTSGYLQFMEQPHLHLSLPSAKGTTLLRVHCKMVREGRNKDFAPWVLQADFTASNQSLVNCPFLSNCLPLSSQNLWGFIC